jgi:hypothetical protein
MAASTEVSVWGRVRKLLEGVSFSPDDTPQELTFNNQEELLVAQGAVPYQEMVRTGRAIKVGTTTAVAAIVAIPTTAVGFAIYNNEPDGGRTFVVDWMAAINAVATAVANQAQMIALVGQVRETAPANAGLVITKMNGMGPAVDCNISTILTATALPATTGLAANWFPVGPSASKPGATALPGYGCYLRVDGAIMCPPGRYLAMSVMASVVGETFNQFIGGHMKQLNLG